MPETTLKMNISANSPARSKPLQGLHLRNIFPLKALKERALLKEKKRNPGDSAEQSAMCSAKIRKKGMKLLAEP